MNLEKEDSAPCANPFSSLYIPQKGRSFVCCDLHKTLPAKSKLTLLDVEMAGVIGNFYLTHMGHSDGKNKKCEILYFRGVAIRCFWDNEATPSVDVPLGDFFGIGFGEDGRLNTIAWERDGKGHMRFMLPMPFKKHARIELVNLTDVDLYGFYWHVEYDAGIPLPSDLEYFHAQYCQSHPVPKNSRHVVLDTEGHGKYIATIWSVDWLNYGTPPENAVSFFVDGEPLQTTNSEDYFGQSWGFCSDEFKTLYVGQGSMQKKTECGSVQMSSYRVHYPNPTLFRHSLRVTIDNQQYNAGYRTDTYDTVCFWYQSHSHKPLAQLPLVEELIPVQYPQSIWHGLRELHLMEKKRQFGEAVIKADSLLHRYPENPKVADIMFKLASLKNQLGLHNEAAAIWEAILKQFPESDAAVDANDMLWLNAKSGRMLMTLVSQSGWTAWLDGREILLPSEIFTNIPDWGEKIHFRYGRPYRLSCFEKNDSANSDNFGAIVLNPYSSTTYDSDENLVKWSNSSSSVMRLFTLRIEPGCGSHVLAVKADVSNETPIRLESQSPGFFAGVISLASGLVVSDGTWLASDMPFEGWFDSTHPHSLWKYAFSYDNDDFPDASWFWLNPAGFRKFPGYFSRLWFGERLNGNRSVYFRKDFII